MTLRGIITGIAVCFSAAIFVSSGWGQPNRKRTTYYPDSITSYYADYSEPIDYSQEIKKSLERLKPPERLVIDSILAELGKKSPDEIFRLKLETDDICQEIDCQGASPATVRRYVEAHAGSAPLMMRTRPRSAVLRQRSGVRSLPPWPQVFLSCRC